MTYEMNLKLNLQEFNNYFVCFIPKTVKFFILLIFESLFYKSNIKEKSYTIKEKPKYNNKKTLNQLKKTEESFFKTYIDCFVTLQLKFLQKSKLNLKTVFN